MKNSFAPSKTRILFVGFGNICRSAIAEGMLRHIATQRGLADRFDVNSAGLGSWHIGSPPDARAQAALALRGIDIEDFRARQVATEDFERFDLIFAMDRQIRSGLLKLAPREHHHKISLFMTHARNLCVQEIPHSSFGDVDGFDYACQLIDAACRGLIVNLTTDAQSYRTAPVAKPTLSVTG